MCLCVAVWGEAMGSASAMEEPWDHRVGQPFAVGRDVRLMRRCRVCYSVRRTGRSRFSTIFRLVLDYGILSYYWFWDPGSSFRTFDASESRAREALPGLRAGSTRSNPVLILPCELKV